MGAGTAIAHTMDSVGASGLMYDNGEGYKGWFVGSKYTVAKNMMLELAWYDLEGRETSSKINSIWTAMQIRF